MVVARLVAAGIAVPRAEAVLVDFANDPPLGKSASTIAVEEGERIVAGLGAAMLASRARRGRIAVREPLAKRSLDLLFAALEAKHIEVVRVPERWPSVGLDRDLGVRHAWVLDGERLLDVAAAALGRPRAPRRITVAGEVARPGVYPHDAPIRIDELVARAGGATVPADGWVALDGGAYGGALADREEPAAHSLVLVLAAAHPLVARARLSVAEQLRRAASACEGCRACTDARPVFLDGTALEPHALVAALSANDDPGNKSAFAAACIGCAVCTAACPAGLAPSVLVAAVKKYIPPFLPALPRGEPHPDREGRRTSIGLLLLRAGLG